MHIGIDVGGTNTDSVLMADRKLVAWSKQPTTADVTAGIRRAVDAVLVEGVSAREVEAVSVGTTHFTNAIVQGKGLARTAAVRLGLPASAGVPPMSGWPADLRTVIGDLRFLCHGGYEYDGSEISPLDPDELKRVAEQLGREDVESVAIASIFSPVNADFEQRAAAILLEELPHLSVSLSHEIGRIGLIERENATIINAALRPIADRTVDAIAEAVQGSGIEAPLFLSQNDGTLMDREYVRRYPVATFAAGPTNSMRGAAFLSGLDDCVVVDIGGTTTDVGAVTAGFPRQAVNSVDMAGVRTNFRMPDVVSIGIGGGSLVDLAGAVQRIGPESVGYRLLEEALVFGGSRLTASDLAVAAGAASFGNADAVSGLDAASVQSGMRAIADRIGALADTMRVSSSDVPLVLVGGGSILLPGEVPGFGTVVRPGDHAGVANAVGAAIAQVGGEVDRVFVFDDGSREQALWEAQEEAVSQAVDAGAEPDSVRILDIDETPLAYLPGRVTRVRVKAVGDLKTGAGR